MLTIITINIKYELVEARPHDHQCAFIYLYTRHAILYVDVEQYE